MTLEHRFSPEEDYKDLITNAIKLGVFIRNLPSSGSVEEKVDLIISRLSVDTNSYLVESVIHALVIDKETSNLSGKTKELETWKMIESLNQSNQYHGNPISEDDSLLRIVTGLGSFVSLYISIQSQLSEEGRQMLMEKIDKLKQIKDEKIAKRATNHMNQIRPADKKEEEGRRF